MYEKFLGILQKPRRQWNPSSVFSLKNERWTNNKDFNAFSDLSVVVVLYFCVFLKILPVFWSSHSSDSNKTPKRTRFQLSRRRYHPLWFLLSFPGSDPTLILFMTTKHIFIQRLEPRPKRCAVSPTRRKIYWERRSRVVCINTGDASWWCNGVLDSAQSVDLLADRPDASSQTHLQVKQKPVQEPSLAETSWDLIPQPSK